MRDQKEIRRAIAILGTALADPGLTRFVWGNYDGARQRAWFCFSVLAWTLGAEETVFSGLLEHVIEKFEQFHQLAQQEEEKDVVH